jgi:MFS family permease
LVSRARRGSPLVFLLVTVFVDMVGYGLLIPLLPFYTQQHAAGAALVGLLGSLYAAMQFVGGPFLGASRIMSGADRSSSSACSARPSHTCCSGWRRR